METRRDYYEVLGVSKDASEDDIKKAFRRLSRKYHPDMQQGKSDAEKKDAEEKFKELASAYEVLGDKDKRQQYDQFGFDDGMSGGMDMDEFMSRHADVFSGMFGFSPFGHSFRPSQREADPREDGQSIRVFTSLTFKESVLGCKKDFKFTYNKECPECHGRGTKSGSKPLVCPHCQGTGAFTQRQRTPFGMSIVTTTCPHCQGAGTISDPCPKCKGTKRVPDTRTISVNIPAGVKNGQRVRISGMGDAGVAGGRNGDVYIEVHVSASPVFSRKDQYDIEILDYPISPLTATFGGKVEVPTLNGIKKLDIPAGTTSGKYFKIAKQGVAGKGDMYIKVNIAPLTKLTSEQEKALKYMMPSLENDNVKGLTALLNNAKMSMS